VRVRQHCIVVLFAVITAVLLKIQVLWNLTPRPMVVTRDLAKLSASVFKVQAVQIFAHVLFVWDCVTSAECGPCLASRRNELEKSERKEWQRHVKLNRC
jgi:hypothetical protein